MQISKRPLHIDEDSINGKVYEFQKGITVTVDKKEYENYDAIEWVLYFENTSDKNSEIFSDICDCDTLLPLEMPEIKNSGYMPATVLYPLVTGGTIAFTSILDRICFGQIIKKQAKIGILLCIVSLILFVTN